MRLTVFNATKGLPTIELLTQQTAGSQDHLDAITLIKGIIKRGAHFGEKGVAAMLNVLATT